MEPEAKQMFSYEKWWRSLFRTTAIIAAIVMITELVGFLAITNYNLPMQERFSDVEHFIRYFAAPSTLFIITLIINRVFIVCRKLSEKTKNYAAIISFTAICVITEIAHGQYLPLLCAPCLAIFLSVIFGDKTLTLTCTVISYISLLTVLFLMLAEGNADENWYMVIISEIIAAIIITCSYVASRSLHKYIVSQQLQMKNDYEKQTKLIEELEIEPLTQLYTKRYLSDYLTGAFEYCKDNGGKMYIAMADVDNFKMINDTYGHKAGDEILSLLGQIIKNNAKGAYRGFRYGGEEFALLFSIGERERVLTCLERIRTDFMQSSGLIGSKVEATVSLGYAGFSEDYNSPNDWLDCADKALYKAKRNGKNCCVHYSKELEKEKFRMTDR